MNKQLLIFVAFAAVLAATVSGFSQSGNGKDVGVALNPVLAMFEWGSAEVTLWNVDRGAEINIPIVFTRKPFFLDDQSHNTNFISTGVNYRRFFGQKQKGFFIQGGWKMDFATASDGFQSTTSTAHSVLFGLGFRVVAQNGLFWGTAINFGRTWGDLLDPYGGVARAEGPALDFDLLKFGYAW